MIDSFTGENFFLSNFYISELEYGGILYNSAEDAFQAAKTLSEDRRNEFAKMTPQEAKATGRKVSLRDDWEVVKNDIMYDICRAKFRHSQSLLKLLLSTGDEELVEGNTWHDNYWGNCTCDTYKDIEGRNQLGKILMKLRNDLREERERT